MSKNKRKRRLKEEDFKKKKLKVGKKLPMPDNVTRTSFKARSINISQQSLLQHGGENETIFRGQNLKNLLSSCAHYNTQAREDALLGLKDIIARHPQVLKDNLNEILQRILGLIADIEYSVRKAFLNVISLLFATLSESEVSPFFPNISAYLCCAMTHINENVRLDSLKFLDISIQYFPRLVSTNSKNIMENFMNVISTEKSSISKSIGIPTTSTLQAKVTSQKIQLETLSRLNHLLHVVLADSGQDNINPTTSNDPASINPTLISSFSLKTSFGVLFESHLLPTDTLGSEIWLVELANTLMPVLFEYWVECCPAEFSMNLIPVKKASVSLHIMKEILEIFVTLVECVEKNVSFNSELCSQFNTHFMKVFPLSFTLKQSGKKAKKAESHKSITDVDLNILIAKLLSFPISELNDCVNAPRWVSEVLAYLQKVLDTKTTNRQHTQLTASNVQSITNLVKIFLLNLPESFESLKAQLLQSIYQLFEVVPAASHTKKILLDFLAEIIDGARNQQPAIKAILDVWLKSLLKILNKKEIRKDMKLKMFLVCKSGIVQRFSNLKEAISDLLPCIIEVENFSKFNEDAQRLVIEILYHIGEVPSCKMFEVLSKLCTSGCLSLQVFKYLMMVIHQLVHCNVNSSVVSSIAGYLSFMLSVVVGCTQEQLENIQSLEKDPNCFDHEVCKQSTLVIEFEGEDGDPQALKESWKQSSEVTCKYLAQSDYSNRFLEMLEGPLCKLFERYPTLPLGVVYRLLYLVATLLHLAEEGGADHSNLLAFVAKWCSLIWHFSLTISTQSNQVNLLCAITKQLKAVISKLCSLSEIILENILNSFIPCTMPGHNTLLTCQVLTEMFKQLQGTLTSIHQPALEVLYQNLESLSSSGMLDSQAFSDFKYNYQSGKIVSAQ